MDPSFVLYLRVIGIYFCCLGSCAKIIFQRCLGNLLNGQQFVVGNRGRSHVDCFAFFSSALSMKFPRILATSVTGASTFRVFVDVCIC